MAFFRAKAMMAREASKTYLSFLWWIVDPLITLAVFYVVFALILKRGTEDYPAFLIVGLICWQWFASTVGGGANSIRDAATLIGQVRFPKLVLPLAVLLTNVFKFLFVFAVLLIALWLFGHGPSIAYLSLPALVALQLLLVYGAATLAAALMPLLPDLQQIIPHLLRAMMFLSAIFYPLSAIPESFHPLFVLNPMALLIDGYREVLLHGRWPDAASLGYAAAGAVGFAVAATLAIRILEPHYSRLVAQR